MTKTTTFTVRYEPDDNGTWLAEVIEKPRIHTHGRTLTRAEANVREAIALWLSVEDGIEIDEGELTVLPEFVFPEINDVSQATQKREEARRVEAEAQALTAKAARKLVVGRKMSLRDAGYLLGISHQRVQQLLEKR